MRRINIALTLLAASAVFAVRTSQVLGTTLDLSTGLDASNALIVIGNSPDAHWTVDQPLGGIAPARVVTASDVEGIYIGSIWAANGPGSSWITIDATTMQNAPVIPYTYYRTFNLTAAEAAQASISGTWGIDDGGELRLNGNLLSSVPNDYTATTPFAAGVGSGLFVAGLNTLTITMTFSDNSGEGVRLTGALAVPEPGMLSLLIVGGLAMFKRNRR